MSGPELTDITTEHALTQLTPAVPRRQVNCSIENGNDFLP